MITVIRRIAPQSGRPRWRSSGGRRPGGCQRQPELLLAEPVQRDMAFRKCGLLGEDVTAPQVIPLVTSSGTRRGNERRGGPRVLRIHLLAEGRLEHLEHPLLLARLAGWLAKSHTEPGRRDRPAGPAAVPRTLKSALRSGPDTRPNQWRGTPAGSCHKRLIRAARATRSHHYQPVWMLATPAVLAGMADVAPGRWRAG